MKPADITISSRNRGSLGAYSVDPVRYGGIPGGWPQSSWQSRIIRTVRRWLSHRRQRQALALLDDRMLKDIGLSRIDVEREIEKPFWQP